MPTSTAAPLASHTFGRRGSKSSWLLIDPELQSAPAKVVPTMIISADTISSAAMPESLRSWARDSTER